MEFGIHSQDAIFDRLRDFVSVERYYFDIIVTINHGTIILVSNKIMTWSNLKLKGHLQFAAIRLESATCVAAHTFSTPINKRIVQNFSQGFCNQIAGYEHNKFLYFPLILQIITCWLHIPVEPSNDCNKVTTAEYNPFAKTVRLKRHLLIKGLALGKISFLNRTAMPSS